MLETEERLFDQYKRVDNICRDMFSSQSGISQYITEMERNPFHSRSAVPLWDEDYRRLKRVRWIRNQIAHEASATDCNENDVAWLEEFHIRLLEQRDPLALLWKSDQKRSRPSPRRECKQGTSEEQRGIENAQGQKKEDIALKRIFMVLIGMAIAAVGMAIAAVFLIFYRIMAI